MSDISTVVQKAEKLCQLARGAVVEAAAGLGALVVEQAPHTSLEELKRRLDRAIEQLEAKRSLSSIAEEMLDSYRFEGGRIRFTVPSGLSDPDVEAMKALNDFRWKRASQDAVSLGALALFRDLPAKYPELCEKRPPQETRKVELVYDKKRLTQQEQKELLSGIDLQFADIRDIAMACALHKLAFNDCLFASYSCARTAIPGVVMYNTREDPTVMVLFDEEEPKYGCEGFFVERRTKERA